MGCYILFKLNILNIYDFDFDKIFPGKAWKCTCELVDTENQHNKEFDWQKVFMYFENTKKYI